MARQDAKHFCQEAAGMQHIMAVQGNQRLLTTQGQRAEQRRVLGFLADQRPARLWIFT